MQRDVALHPATRPQHAKHDDRGDVVSDTDATASSVETIAMHTLPIALS